jgi:hypothetical protein
MDRFETESLALLPGQRVRARIVSHHAWGVGVQIIGHEHVDASADLIGQFGATVPPGEMQAMFPHVGAEIDAVVQQVQRYRPPAWVRLSIRAADLESFTWPCDFCQKPVPLSAGATTDQAAAHSSATGYASPAGCTRTAPNERGFSGSER